jgi:hypothetical protein
VGRAISSGWQGRPDFSAVGRPTRGFELTAPNGVRAPDPETRLIAIAKVGGRTLFAAAPCSWPPTNEGARCGAKTRSGTRPGDYSGSILDKAPRQLAATHIEQENNRKDPRRKDGNHQVVPLLNSTGFDAWQIILEQRILTRGKMGGEKRLGLGRARL